MLSSAVFSQIFSYLKLASDLIGNLSFPSIVFGSPFPQWIRYRQTVLHRSVVWELPCFVYGSAVVVSFLSEKVKSFTKTACLSRCLYYAATDILIIGNLSTFCIHQSSLWFCYDKCTFVVGAEGSEPVSVIVKQRWHIYKVIDFANLE